MYWCEGRGRGRVRTQKVLKLWIWTFPWSLQAWLALLQKNILLQYCLTALLFIYWFSVIQSTMKDRISEFPDNYLDLRSSLTSKQPFFALLSVAAQGWPRAVAWQVISGTCRKWRMFATRSELSELVLQTKAIRRFVITEKASTRAFPWLKAATTTFTFKTLF